MSGPRWEPFEVFVIRGAGFPLRLLDGLRSEALLAGVRADAGAGRRVAQLDAEMRAAAARAGRPPTPEDGARAREVARAVRRRRPLAGDEPRWLEAALGLPGWAGAWNEAIARLEAGAAATAERYREGLHRARAAMAAAAGDPRFQEAVFLMSPDVLRNSVRHVRDGRVGADGPNQDERKLAFYLQRVAAKCETHAFFGPIAYGAIGEEFPGWTGDAGRREARGFVAFWALRELVLAGLRTDPDLASRTPRPGPVPHRQLPPAMGRLLDAVDGRRSWREAAAAAGVGAPSADVVARLDRMGMAWTAPTMATSEPDGWVELRRALGDGGEPAAGRRLRELADEFASGGVETRERALRGAEAVLRDAGVGEVRRGAGELYADRVALYEEDYDGSRSWRLTAPAAAALSAAVDPVLDLVAAAAGWAAGRAHEALLDDLRRRGPDAGGASLAAFLAGGGRLSVPVPLEESPAMAAFADLAGERWDGHAPEVDVPAADLRRRLAGQVPRAEPLCASPDVMLIGRSRAAIEAGELDVLVGEVHWGLQVFGNLCCFIEDREALVRRVREWLGPSTAGVLNVALGRRFGKLCYLEVFPRTLELLGPAAHRQPAVRAERLTLDGAGCLRDAATGEPVRLMMGDAAGREFSALSLPALRLPTVRLGDRTPRLRVGRAIVQRAAWWCPTDELAALRPLPAPDRYRGVVGWAGRLGLPDRVFVHVPGERKPFYVDLASPHLVDVLVHAVRPGELRVTELLPGPEQLWLDTGEGPVACELRLAMVRRFDEEEGAPGA
jgi:hypothetical protein